MFAQLNQDTLCKAGGLAQMVERPLSMREVPGSTPGFSKYPLFCTPKSTSLHTLMFLGIILTVPCESRILQVVLT